MKFDDDTEAEQILETVRGKMDEITTSLMQAIEEIQLIQTLAPSPGNRVRTMLMKNAMHAAIASLNNSYYWIDIMWPDESEDGTFYIEPEDGDSDE
jgi:hypothetical protein